MLTEVKAFSSWRSAPTLPLNGNHPETDLIQVRNITGLDPVKASITTTPFGVVDGASYNGGSVPSRNIVLTLRPNPDWDNWTYEKLRQLLYSYFMPKRPTRLEFYREDDIPVEISGIVEGVQVNMFSKDPELQVSIICPDPYFTAIDPKVITGQTIVKGGEPIIIDYEGTIETGIYAKVTYVQDPKPTWIDIQIGEEIQQYFWVEASVDASSYFEMSSIPMRKYVQKIDMTTGVITNLLGKMYAGSGWPVLEPGENEFSVITQGAQASDPQGVQDWELTYFERFGGL